MQKHRLPSFFQTSTTALHHGDWLGHITPASSMSLSEACTSQKWWRNVPKPLFEGLTIVDLDFVLNCTHATKFISIQCKDVMEGQDQLSCSSHIYWGPITQTIQVQLLEELFLLRGYCRGLTCSFGSKSCFHLGG